MTFTDSASNLTEREQKRLKNSWADRFSKDIFPMINEERFSVLYSNNKATRPNNPVNVTVGTLMLKSIFVQSDEENMDSLMFDIRYQHALHTTSFEEQPISKNSLSNFRCAVYKYYEETGIDLIQEEVESHAKAFAAILGLDGKMQRMDSLMISSSCKKLSRLELIYSCVSRLIKTVDNFNNSIGGFTILEEFKRYLKEGHQNEVIYRTRDTELSSKLETVIKDAIKLHSIYKDTMIAQTEEYELLSRMISDQTDEKSNLKEGKSIAPDSLQNPTDPDATFRTKGNKRNIGYVGNVVETFDNENRIITDYDLKQNSYSDVSFSQDIIDKLGKREDETNMLIDGAYYSDVLAKAAAENNINLIPTTMVGRQSSEKSKGSENFVIDEEKHEVVNCPIGNVPVKSSYVNGVYKAHFEKETCKGCPFTNCPLIKQKKMNLFMISEKAYHIAKSKAHMKTDEYKAIAKKRAGIEGVPSVLRRRYDIDNLPVRKRIRTKIWFGLMIYAINFKRYIKKDIIPKVTEEKAVVFAANVIFEKYLVVNVQLLLNLFKPCRYNHI
jgi:hypothetical protein